MARRERPVSRRAFLRTAASAATLAAPLFVPATALGRGGRPAPSERFTLGAIGTGDRGRYNLGRFLEYPEVEVVALSDVDTRHLEKARAKVEKHYAREKRGSRHRGLSLVREFERVVERPDIDLVSIATPDHWHALTAIAAARAGKDIFCEKPLALTIPEGRAIADAVRRHGTVWQTGSWQRSRRRFRFACELVRNGRIGKLHTVRVGLPNGKRGGSTEVVPVPEELDYDRWLGPAPWAPYTEDRTHYDFRWHLDYSGGVLTDWGAHHIDIVHWAMDTERGGPVEIEGRGDFPERGLWNAADTFFFECRYANGVRVTVSSKKNPNRQGVRFEGDRGWVFVARGKLEAEPRSLLRTTFGPEEPWLYRSRDHWENFLECVKSRRETITPAEIAHRSVTVAHLGNIAMRLGRKVRWNPAAERFVDDPDADRLLHRPMREPWRL